MVALCIRSASYFPALNKVVDGLRFSSTLPRPSKLAQAVLRELYGTQIRNSMLSGRSIGRKDRVCGQMGVINRAGICG